jgi:hypothetical protein
MALAAMCNVVSILVLSLYQVFVIHARHTGELVALMGPSGCGKTTLLNVLAQRAASSGAKVLGQTYINDTQIDSRTFQQVTSYVEQEDVLIGSLTVQETLKFAADLSLPRYVMLQSQPPMDHLDSPDTDYSFFEQFGIKTRAHGSNPYTSGSIRYSETGEHPGWHPHPQGYQRWSKAASECC